MTMPGGFAASDIAPRATDWSGEAMQRRIRKRYASERRFRLIGLSAILISAGFLAFLLVTMLGNGVTVPELTSGPTEAGSFAQLTPA